MQIQRAINLGALHQTLGIDKDARICFQLSPLGLTVWDLASEAVYSITGNPPTVTKDAFALPQLIKDIIASSTDTLKQRFRETWMDGWSSERETIFTELAYRGVDLLNL